jgi:Pyruvate/2-oxoacid:ferredoxin oxidoreductase delta subunit
MIRKIIEIDKDKCNGCGLCVNACHEAAIIMKNGKAELVSDEYCDGLGDCLPNCPMDAINMVEREAKEYDEEKVKERIDNLKSKENENSQIKFKGCPGSREMKFNKSIKNKEESDIQNKEKSDIPSELQQWPIQLNLVNPNAEYLKNADILVAADCTAFSYGAFHRDFIKNKITIIGCPKLDDNEYYREKLENIFKNATPNSITVVRMEVPCCHGIVNSVKQAMLKAEVIVNYKEVIISTDGKILK